MNVWYVIVAESFNHLDERLDILETRVKEKLSAQGLPGDRIYTQCFLHLRYEGTDCALMCTPTIQKNSKVSSLRHGDFLTPFLER